MSPREAPERLPGWAAILLLVIAGFFFVLLVAHAVASWQVFMSRDTRSSLDVRISAAAAAKSIEPWNPAMRAGYGYLVSQRLFAQGRHSLAVDVMAAAYKDAVGDPELLAYFKRIQDALTLETNRKAHLQHGHEGPGGTLRPSDIER
jgi:hypothetical protein